MTTSGKLTVTTFLTLDGVYQAPGGPNEDRDGGFEHGGWVVPYFDDDMFSFINDVFTRADGFLLGRRTYEIFASHWPRVTDKSDPVASALNGLPKYVASRTLKQADWRGTTIVRDVERKAAELKRRYVREIQVHGSGQMIQTLLAKELVGELNLLLFPVLLGSGKRLFGSGSVPAAFSPEGTRTTSTGVVITTYRRAGKPTYGAVGLETA
jgi:dihydrofolate reductase